MEDGPAVILVGGAPRWYKEGKYSLPSAHETIIYKINEKHNSILLTYISRFILLPA
jgi:hypothetical protein